MDRREQLRDRLIAVRGETLRLFEQVPDDFLRRRVHSFYSPIGWHFGHVGRTEEYWVGQATGLAPCSAELSFLYADLPDNPKDNRVHIPDREGTLRYLERTREAALEALDRANFDDSNALLADGYAWEFAIQHECQHQETITEMLCLIHKEIGGRLPRGLHAEQGSAQEFGLVPKGKFLMGSDDRHGYDNEKAAHEVAVDAFYLATEPVTAGQWLRFMAADGYLRKEFWSRKGWAWRRAESVIAPEYWFPAEDGGWGSYGMFGPRELHPEEPVTCISWFEADAFCRWAWKRLPTEVEWEYAAAGLAERRYPWGENSPSDTMAVYGRHRGGPAPVGTCPKGEAPFGMLDMAGNCWEWTASPFRPYPGFRPFPYDGYSKDHMDGRHFVCRGGSWATAGPILRCSFRNWYVPSYRQGFIGLRLAESDGPLSAL
jgi:iron(II)-dependent oxidoreductase